MSLAQVALSFTAVIAIGLLVAILFNDIINQ
jgi:hypothetical protein